MNEIKCYVCMTEENCNCDQDAMLIAENEYLHKTLQTSRDANIASIERAIKAEQRVEKLENRVEALDMKVEAFEQDCNTQRERAEMAEQRIEDLLDEIRTLGVG